MAEQDRLLDLEAKQCYNDFNYRKRCVIDDLLLEPSTEQMINGLRIKRFLDLLLEEYGLNNPKCFELLHTCPENYENQWLSELIKFEASTLNYILHALIEEDWNNTRKENRKMKGKFRRVNQPDDLTKSIDQLSADISSASLPTSTESLDKVNFNPIISKLLEVYNKSHLISKNSTDLTASIQLLQMCKTLKIVSNQEFKRLNLDGIHRPENLSSTQYNAAEDSFVKDEAKIMEIELKGNVDQSLKEREHQGFIQPSQGYNYAPQVCPPFPFDYNKFLHDPITAKTFNPANGFAFDYASGLVTDPVTGLTFDYASGLVLDPVTNFYYPLSQFNQQLAPQFKGQTNQINVSRSERPQRRLTSDDYKPVYDHNNKY